MSVTPLKLVDKDDMDKQKALDAALGQIERAFGKGSVMKLGESRSVVEAEAVSSGSLGLDIALGIGGLPRGRVVEIYGPEASGKRRWRSTSSVRPRSWAAPAPSSTPNTPSIRSTPASSASTSMSC